MTTVAGTGEQLRERVLPGGSAAGAACHRYQQGRGIPIRLPDGAPAELELDLRAV